MEAWPQIGLTPSPTTTTIPFFPIEYVGTFTIHKQLLLLRKKRGMSHEEQVNRRCTTGGISVPFGFSEKKMNKMGPIVLMAILRTLCL